MKITRIDDRGRSASLKSEGSSDFVVRKRPIGIRLSLLFASAIMAIYGIALIMGYSGNKGILLVVLMVVFGIVGWVVVIDMTRNRDLVTATEFMNALLSSAAMLSLRFCLIIKSDGSIVYVDPGFQKNFPEFMRSGNQTIHALFMGTEFTHKASNKIAALLEKNENGRVVIPFKDAASENFSSVMISVDLLPRPQGYVLLRGRNYIESRADSSKEATISLLAQALNLLTEGIVLADATGKVTHSNSVFDTLLGYQSGELAASSQTLDKIYQHYDESHAGEAVIGAFRGEATFRTKSGLPLVLWICQTIHYDVKGMPIGVSVFVNKTNATISK